MATTIFGQLVVGPPGSGKSTYCKFICENLKQIGRNAKIINLDPANDCLQYKPAIDVFELINVDKVMDEAKYGPNGAIIYCMETLSKNVGWLFDKIVMLMEEERKQYIEARKQLKKAEKDSGKSGGNSSGVNENDVRACRPYLLFDCPGQLELYVHNKAMRDIIKNLTRRNKYFDLRLACVNLCDAYHASDTGKYVSLVMNSLTTMMNLELPHVNVLSKVDKIDRYGKTRFNLEYYCEIPTMRYLIESEPESPFHRKYRNLSEAICDVIDDYSLVFFVPLNIQKAEDIKNIMQIVDKANGYCIDDLDLSILQMNPKLMEMASGRRLEPLEDAIL